MKILVDKMPSTSGECFFSSSPYELGTTKETERMCVLKIGRRDSAQIYHACCLGRASAYECNVKTCRYLKEIGEE